MYKRNKIFRIIILTLLIFSGTETILPQHNLILDYKFRNLTTKDGLSSNSVQACLLDSYGFMWIGTQCGLNRYDGQTVKSYLHINSDSTTIGDDFIWSIFEDDEKYLWIGTNNGGLNRYDPKTDKFIRYMHNPADNNSISNNTVNCIIEDNDKNLWLATMNGINKFDRKTQKFIRYIHSKTDSNSISYNGRSTLFKDKTGNIFVGTKFGLNKYIKSKDNFHRIHLAENDYFEILCISQDESGIFWLGTQAKGIFKYDETKGIIENIMPEPGSKNTIASNAVRAIIHCDNGLIWIGHLTEKAGLDIYDAKTNTYYNFKHDKSDEKSLALDVMWDIYKDKYKNMWVCTNGGGVSCYSDYAIKFMHIKKLWGDGYSRDLKVIWGVLYAYNRFWCYTEGSILSFSKYGEFIKEYNPANSTLRLFTPLRVGKTSGRMYVGDLDNCLTYYDSIKDVFVKCPIKLKNTVFKPGETTGAVYEDKDGNIWLGKAEHGLLKLDKNFSQIDIFEPSDSLKNNICKSWTNCIYEDSKNFLWFGGRGLSKINLKTGELFNFKEDDKSPYLPAGGGLVSDFFEDGKGNMWITYGGNGFDKLDLKNNIYKHYNISNGLINNNILSVKPDNSGNFWFSSAKGIIKFNPEKETYTNYDISDGVQDDEFNNDCFCVADDGMIAFGGVNGINYFYPDKMKINPHVPPIAITYFSVFDKELISLQNINFIDEIILSHKDNFFHIHFAALDYANPLKNQFKYKLEGIDDDWVSSGNKNEVNYTDIAPGDYIFRVKGSNNDGVWNEEGKSIKITIAPPWWKTWWCRSFIVVLIIGFTVFGVNRKFERINKEKAAQEEFTRKLIDSQEQERKRISAELHDSVGQDLVIIKNSANMALNKIKTESEASKFINQISEISSSALSNVRAISHNLRPAELDKLGLTETIKSIIEMVSSSSEINFSSEINSIDNVFSKDNEVNFCRIIQECLNNILKHSKAVNASIQIKVSEKEVLTIIKDDGIGFDIDKIISDKSITNFGLTGINERVKMLSGTLRVNSKPGEGTEIIITNPVIKN